MNIFAIDRDPVIAAKHAVDSHTVKMVLESAQMLANCFSPEQLASTSCPRAKTGSIRKHSYYNHPCSKWVRASKENMRWLCLHAIALDAERIERMILKHGEEAKPLPHFSLTFIYWALDNIHIAQVPDGPLTEFAQAMPDEFKCEDSLVAYRKLYKFGKAHLHQWTRNKPEWVENNTI